MHSVLMENFELIIAVQHVQQPKKLLYCQFERIWFEVTSVR